MFTDFTVPDPAILGALSCRVLNVFRDAGKSDLVRWRAELLLDVHVLLAVMKGQIQIRLGRTRILVLLLLA